MKSTKDNSSNTNYPDKEKALWLNVVETLNEDKQIILFEVLKCGICLELPKGKQVRICEKGHHFCITCHTKIKVCGICRGKLLDVRNFVVEELVTKLGPILCQTENEVAIQTPAKPIPGSFQCLHNCSASVPSFRMLNHLRKKHSENLIENVVCNPCTNRFSLKYKIVFQLNERYIFSAFIADLGLCTIEAFFLDENFYGCCRLLVDRSDLPHFRYQLVVKIHASQMIVEYGITDCAVSHYSDDRQSIIKQGNVLKIKSSTFLELISEESIIIFFSIWRKSEKKNKECLIPSITCPSESHLHMENNRKSRRNRNRNARRKRLKSQLIAI